MRRLALPVALLAALAAGCGAERPAGVNRAIPTDAPKRRIHYPAVGLALTVPRFGTVEPRRRPGVFRVSLGSGFAAAFAYRRREQIPRSRGELRTAERRLVRQVKRRSKGFHLISARTKRVAGSPAVELVGDQTISRTRLRTRSVHVFKGRAEYVLDMLAPVPTFRVIDRSVFTPMVRSLRVTGKIKKERRKRGKGR